jgi:acylphosphatase
MHRLAVVFSGRVQGVGFRYTTREVADGFAVTGWVQNMPGGTVRLEVQGDAGMVSAMVDALRDRMVDYITDSKVEPMVVSPGEAGFGIRR